MTYIEDNPKFHQWLLMPIVGIIYAVLFSAIGGSLIAFIGALSDNIIILLAIDVIRSGLFAAGLAVGCCQMVPQYETQIKKTLGFLWTVAGALITVVALTKEEYKLALQLFLGCGACALITYKLIEG